MQEPRTTCQVFVNPLDWVFNVGSTIDFLRTCEPLDAVCKESSVLLFFFFLVYVYLCTFLERIISFDHILRGVHGSKRFMPTALSSWLGF